MISPLALVDVLRMGANHSAFFTVVERVLHHNNGSTIFSFPKATSTSIKLSWFDLFSPSGGASIQGLKRIAWAASGGSDDFGGNSARSSGL